MSYIGVIFLNVIFPMLILLAIGGALQKKFNFNLRALSNLITYCLMPATVFVNIYLTEIDPQLLVEIMVYLLLFGGTLIILGSIFSKLLKLNKGQSAVFKNSVSLINSGNYGLPVSQLVFQTHPLGMAVQIIVLVFQNVLTFTYGLYNLISATKSGLEIVRSLFKMPIIHALIAGGILNALNIPIPQFLWLPIEHLSDAIIAVALITLGAQLIQIKFKFLDKVIIAGSIGRLIIGPAVALAFIYIMGIEGIVAQSLFIASSFPSSRNSSSLALEYDVEPDRAAQTVLFTTLLSSLTVAFVIYLSTILFLQ
ncbi:AEC family transporter [Chungangia koreensis]|uniref:AEC family transporter n=2 Tax=Chungangia koreensis TaxID=752657 RepID=A0ABV8X601_9LACT